MKRNLFIIAAFGIVGLASCAKKLDQQPPNGLTGTEVFSTPTGATEAMAKVYAAYALTGSNGNASSDLGGIDAGTSDYIRLLFDASELSTDEAVCAWGDPGVPDFHNMQWSSGNVILEGLYYRCMYQITVANSFLQQAEAANTASWSSTDKANLAYYMAESRFLRAFQYWQLMDLFGNPPFVTEKDPIGSYVPPQITRANLFSWVESELKSLDSSNAMVPARQNVYGRADQACVWALLARMYLNAGVYLGSANATQYYTDAITYSSKVINAGYKLDSSYQNLFLADNNTNNPEQILSINYNAVNTQTYGGTTFIINAEIGGSMVPGNYGVPSGGWGGNRVTANIPALYQSGDVRSLFYTNGQSLQISDIGTFTDGYASVKFSNLTSKGATPPGATDFANTSFPLFRLAEQYLIYAEAVSRGGSGGSTALALQYYNAVRSRGYNYQGGTVGSYSLQDILDERGREFLWECQRRDDLIRFGLFTSGTYLWPWKGGVASGTGVDDKYNLFPIPSTDLTANPNLIQNPGY
jgi:hypothetical protein